MTAFTELEEFRTKVRRVVEREVRPHAEAVDREGIYPWPSLRALAANGYLGVTVPAEYGGRGLGLRHLCVVLEEVGRGCGTTSQTMIGHYLCITSLLQHGTDEQRDRYLPDLAAGGRLGTFAITEPASGSNVSDMATRAEEADGGFVLDGRKTFIGNVNEASILIVFAATEPEKGARGITSFILEKGTPGFTSSEREGMMGLRGADVGDVILNRCRLPRSQLLGQKGRGFHQAMQTLDVTRPTVGAQAIGVAQAAYEASVEFCRHRHVFGKPLAEHQATQFSLADMYVALHAGRLTVMHAAECFDDNRLPFNKEAAAAKVFATECAGTVVDKAVQLHGGLGYLSRCPVERYYRDARVFRIYEGTSEIQRLVIAKRLLGESCERRA